MVYRALRLKTPHVASRLNHTDTSLGYVTRIRHTDTSLDSHWNLTPNRRELLGRFKKKKKKYEHSALEVPTAAAMNIPTVDIGCYVTGGDLQSDDVKQTVKLLHEAISEHGFCYLKNHGVPRELVENVLKSSRQFFKLPCSTKLQFARPQDSDKNHGWVDLERERLNPDRPYADLKEAFNYRPGEKGPMPTEEVSDFETDLEKFFTACCRLTEKVLDLSGLALGIEDVNFLRNCHQLMGKEKNFTTVRSLYYPLEHHDTRHGQLYCSEHSDYGSITLLFQDSTGGLQILGKDGEYHDVPRVPDAVLLNIGDLMQRWTADKYPSTKHRVVVAQDALERRQDRQSIAFFVQPDNDALITCLDGSNKYPPITSFDYLMQRYGVTY